jgi:hypothetical protein
MAPEELRDLVVSFCLKKKAGTIDLREFIASARPGAADTEIDGALRELEKKRRVILSPAVGPIRAVTLPDFPIVALAEEYRLLSVDPVRPFPKDDSLPAQLDPTDIAAVDVKKDFASFLAGKDAAAPPAARLLFPEGIDSMVVPRAAAGAVLVEAAAAKVSAYLQDPRNAGYAESKLVALVKGNDIVVRQMMEDAATRPKKAAASILAPSDFAFRFWTHLANLVLQDFRKKKEKTSQDHGVCQSAFIIGYYVFFQKGENQREQERNADLKTLENQVRKPPYVFTYEEMYGLRDEKGVPYVNKHTRGFIHTFLEEKSRRTSGEGLPFLVRFHAGTVNKDYFVQKDLIVPVFLKKLTEAAEDLRGEYLTEWEAALRRRQSSSVMKSDAPFQKDVEIRIKENYPLLGALANGPVLFVAKEEAALSEEAAADIRRCFTESHELLPLADCLQLSRAQLYTQARSRLPMWETMPVLSQIIAFFRRILSGKPRSVRPAKAAQARPSGRPAPQAAAPAAETAAGETRKNAGSPVSREREALVRYTRAIKGLKEHFAPAGRSMDALLDELSNKWNPLFADAQKRDLVEDVNALIRDFLRPVRRTFLVAPPDLARIRALAEQLSEAKSLEQIKKKEPLLRYIELYMVQCLEPRKAR